MSERLDLTEAAGESVGERLNRERYNYYVLFVTFVAASVMVLILGKMALLSGNAFTVIGWMVLFGATTASIVATTDNLQPSTHIAEREEFFGNVSLLERIIVYATNCGTLGIVFVGIGVCIAIATGHSDNNFAPTSSVICIFVIIFVSCCVAADNTSSVGPR